MTLRAKALLMSECSSKQTSDQRNRFNVNEAANHLFAKEGLCGVAEVNCTKRLNGKAHK